MTPTEPIELNLDKPRKLLITHGALFKAESEINKLRGSTPESYVSIDVLMVDAFNHLYRARGLLPRDLLVVMIWAGISAYQQKEKTKDRLLTVEQIADLLDESQTSVAELSGELWAAYFKANTRSLKQTESAGEGEPEKKSDMIQADGSTSGALPASN